MADTLLRETQPPVGAYPSPKPQAWDPVTSGYKAITGTDLGSGRFGSDVLAWGKTAGGIFVPIRVNDSGEQAVTLSGSNVAVQEIVASGTNIAIAAGASYFSNRVDTTKYVALGTDVLFDSQPATAPNHLLLQTSALVNGYDLPTGTMSSQGGGLYGIRRVTRDFGTRAYISIKNNDTISHTVTWNLYGYRE